MNHVTFDRMPAALGLLLDRLEALRAEVAELRAAIAMARQDKGGGGGGPEGGLLTFAEAMAHLRVARTTLSRWKREGAVPFVRVGTRTYFRAADLESYGRHDVGRPPGLERGRP